MTIIIKLDDTFPTTPPTLKEIAVKYLIGEINIPPQNIEFYNPVGREREPALIVEEENTSNQPDTKIDIDNHTITCPV